MKKRTKKQVEEARDSAMKIVAHNAEESFEQFSARAQETIVHYLERNGKQSCEALTDHCISRGIVPHDERAFGPVYAALARKGIIRRVGWVPRMKGHGTSGGSVWDLVESGNQ